MKITYIRNKDGSKLTATDVETIGLYIQARLAKVGFITDLKASTQTSFVLGQHMRSFSLDLTKHDRNLYRSTCGDKLTNLPTWDQRVEYNNIVNRCLNKYKVSANIVSGPYTIRKGFKCFDEYDWQDQKPSWIYENERRGYGPIESINEKEYLAFRKFKRAKQAAEKREMNRQREEKTPHLSLIDGAQ